MSDTYRCGYCIIGNHHKCILSVDTPSGHYLCSCGFGQPHEGPPKPKKIKVEPGLKPPTRKRAAAKTKAKSKKES